jgi:hypothetical protein
MPSSEDRGSRCWNCDQEAARRIPVILRFESGGVTRLLICRSCHAEVYGPLAATIEPGHLTMTGLS